jgi:hypothetical protein
MADGVARVTTKGSRIRAAGSDGTMLMAVESHGERWERTGSARSDKERG